MFIKDDGYVVVKKIISDELVKFICAQYEIVMAVNHFCYNPHNPDYRGDSPVPKSFSLYGAIVSETLLSFLKDKASDVCNVKLTPTYSYSRMYFKGATLGAHRDRPACQYSCTINLSIEGEPWPIWFSKKNGEDVSIFLEPGDACFYLGTEIEHWREEFKGEKMLQFFLHYVETDGIYKDQILDNRPYLGALFGKTPFF